MGDGFYRSKDPTNIINHNHRQKIITNHRVIS